MNLLEVFQSSNATVFQCVGLNYNCFFCDDQYSEPIQLKQHTLSSHHIDGTVNLIKSRDMTSFHLKVDITGLHCNICSQDMETLDELMQHLNEEHKKTLSMEAKKLMVPFKFNSDVILCFICLKVFGTFKGLLEHMNTNCRNFVCKVCDGGFITRSGLWHHLRVHETGTFGCKFCNKVFSTRLRQRSHEKYVHSGVTQNKCRICSDSFRNYSQKVKHMLDVHGVSHKVMKCHACDRTFSSQKGLLNHTKRDHLMERSHSCPHCETKFYTSTQLKEHLTKHTGDRKFHCDVCFKAYWRMSTLREHLRIHANDRRFKCEQCDVAFVQKSSWRVHMRAKHTDQRMEKKHSCAHCEMKFYKSTQLKEHLTKHTGEKQFQCDVCLKAYRRKSTLREHLRIHADDRRFKCEHCGVAFVQKSSWRVHMRAKHAELI